MLPLMGVMRKAGDHWASVTVRNAHRSVSATLLPCMPCLHDFERHDLLWPKAVGESGEER